MPTKDTAYGYLAKLYWTLGRIDNNPTSAYWATAKNYDDTVLLQIRIMGTR